MTNGAGGTGDGEFSVTAPTMCLDLYVFLYLLGLVSDNWVKV